MSSDLSNMLLPLRSNRVDAAFIEVGEGSGVELASVQSSFLHLLIAGEGKVYPAGRHGPSNLSKPGDHVLVLNTGRHRLGTKGGGEASPSDYWRRKHDHDWLPTLRFGSGRLALRTLSARLQVDASNPLVRAMPRMVVMPSDTNPLALGFASSLHGSGTSALATALVDILVLTAARTIGLPLVSGGSQGAPHQTRVPRVRNLLDSNLQRRWTLAAMAAEIGVSRSTLAVEFLAETGKPPIAYLLNRRMEHARDLLQSSALAIAEIGWRCGYESPAAFSRTFKRHFGQTPAQERASSLQPNEPGQHRHLHWSAFLDDDE